MSGTEDTHLNLLDRLSVEQLTVSFSESTGAFRCVCDVRCGSGRDGKEGKPLADLAHHEKLCPVQYDLRICVLLQGVSWEATRQTTFSSAPACVAARSPTTCTLEVAAFSQGQLLKGMQVGQVFCPGHAQSASALS